MRAPEVCAARHPIYIIRPLFDPGSFSLELSDNWTVTHISFACSMLTHITEEEFMQQTGIYNHRL